MIKRLFFSVLLITCTLINISNIYGMQQEEIQIDGLASQEAGSDPIQVDDTIGQNTNNLNIASSNYSLFIKLSDEQKKVADSLPDCIRRH